VIKRSSWIMPRGVARAIRTSASYARLLGARYWLAAAGGAALIAVAIGVPTDVISNPWFTRQIDVRPLDYVFLALTSTLTGALLATYTLPSVSRDTGGRRAGLGAGLLAWFAVGCPVCNKLVVLLLGSSGALNYFAPIQPVLGVLAVAMAATALAVRLRGYFAGCRLAPHPAG
jgi:hypothetical protein